MPDLSSTASNLTDFWTIEAAVDHQDPDPLLLVALVLGGLVHPADALAIALIGTEQRRSTSDPALGP